MYLENQGYIASYIMTHDAYKTEWSFGQGADEDLKLSIPFPDHELVKNLINYLFKEIIPLEPLKDLAAHNFVAPEERRFRKQYKLAITAIAISIIIGLSVITLNIKSQYSQKDAVIENSKYIKGEIKLLGEINENIHGAAASQLSELQQLKAITNENNHNNVKGLNEISNALESISNKIDILKEKSEHESPKVKN